MSKGLEALNKIDNEVLYGVYAQEHYSNEIETIRKSLKALEIIKEKRIDIESFYTSFIEGDYDYSFYERRYGTYGKYCLTEEEFNTLKEVLE